MTSGRATGAGRSRSATAGLAALLAAALVATACSGTDPAIPAGAASAASSSPTPEPSSAPSASTSGPASTSAGTIVAEAANPTGQLVVPDGDAAAAADQADATEVAAPAAPVASDDTRAFEAAFPSHAAAVEDPADPATSRWALLIGVNDHSGRTRDNIGSRQDAERLGEHLRDLGWQDDHVLVLTDGTATRDTIVQAIQWLSRKTTGESHVVFSYSGHTKQWHDQDVDGDGEMTDEGLWPSDNQHVTDREWVDLMRPVEGRLWINLMGCEGAGYVDPGLASAGRIITFSSGEAEKSYEDPSVDQSVWNWNLVSEGMRDGQADANGDGDVTVQEAAEFAIPRAQERTRLQTPHGPQIGGIIDRAGGPFSLQIPQPVPSDS